MKARTPTSVPGSRRGAGAAGGFTLVELLIVLLLVAMASGLAGLALRDSDEARLEREAVRLAAMLEAARAESRASGMPVRFELASAANALGEHFRFQGLPAGTLSARRWLDPGVQAQIVGASALQLGPEPLIGAQRVVLWLGGRQRTLATDGLAPFAPVGSEPADTPPPTAAPAR